MERSQQPRKTKQLFRLGNILFVLSLLAACQAFVNVDIKLSNFGIKSHTIYLIAEIRGDMWIAGFFSMILLSIIIFFKSLKQREPIIRPLLMGLFTFLTFLRFLFFVIDDFSVAHQTEVEREFKKLPPGNDSRR